MKQFRLLLMYPLLGVLLLTLSCSESEKVDLPTSALIHFSVLDKQVAFTALTHNAETYFWDFGDGQTSNEKDPVHIYETGYYTATLTVTGGTGTAEDVADLTIGAPPYGLLTGGPNATEGKTWRISSGHSAFDYFAYSDPAFTTALPDFTPLPVGVFGLLGMGEVYADEFTFYFDGSYKIDVKDDKAAFTGVIYQLATGGTLVNTGGLDFGLVTALYTPASDDSFIFQESEDYNVPSAFGDGGVAVYNGVSTIDFTGNAYLGFLDLNRKVIVQELTNTRMRAAIFASVDPDAFAAGLATNAIILTFEVVN